MRHLSIIEALSTLEKEGYFIQQQLPSDSLLEFVQSLGDIVADKRSPERIREIRPQSTSEAPPNTLSSRYGSGEFPFHTNSAHWAEPPRLLIMHCVHAGSGNRPTRLQDSRSWKLNIAQRESATREIWKTGHLVPQLCTVASYVSDRFSLRYDEACMTPMTRNAWRLREELTAHIANAPVVEITWSDGLLLMIDNHRMLHARGTATQEDSDRVLNRILVRERI